MRRYSITCDGFQPSLLEGGFSFSASDAGHKWIAENLPGSAPCDVIYQRTGEVFMTRRRTRSISPNVSSRFPWERRND